jgi:hypothetical protein
MGARPDRQRLTQAMLKAEGIDLLKMMGETLPQLDARDQMQALINLAGFVYPKPKVIEHGVPEGHKMTMTIGG